MGSSIYLLMHDPSVFQCKIEHVYAHIYKYKLMCMHAHILNLAPIFYSVSGSNMIASASMISGIILYVAIA